MIFLNITYGQAGPQDAESIFELCKNLIDTYEQTDAIDYPRVLNWVQRKLHNSIGEYTVIHVQGQKAGYFHFFLNEEGQYELDDLYILPEFQGRGIGTRIIRECLSSVDAPVVLYVFTGNTRAVSLYRKLGFQTVKTLGATRCILRHENKKHLQTM